MADLTHNDVSILYFISRQVSFLCPESAQTQTPLLVVFPHLEFTQDSTGN